MASTASVARNGNRGFNPASDERQVGRLVSVAEDPQGDLRPAAVQRLRHRAPPRPADGDDVTAFGPHVDHIRAIDPRMAGLQALVASRGDDNGGHGQGS